MGKGNKTDKYGIPTGDDSRSSPMYVPIKKHKNNPFSKPDSKRYKSKHRRYNTDEN